MQRWVVFCWALLALVAAEECPDGGKCGQGQTCCNDPTNGYECCPLELAECCGDHTHCCPAGTVCNSAKSSCDNATMSIPWVERASADQLRLSKSFRMITAYMGEEDDNICPDQSRCPAEFSCLKALTRFGCCPLAQGVPCSDGKHCCPESHQCSVDSSSCIRKDLGPIVLCNDGVSECPDQTTCCEGPEGTWGCCPMPEAICCEDKLHCCPGGCTCDIQNSKCISTSTQKEMPMWAKLPARIRAEWENNKEVEVVTAETANDGASDKVTTAYTVAPSGQETSVSSVTKGVGGNDVPCSDTAACLDGYTCCPTKDHGWTCCPLPEAVCCDDHLHCCPHDTTCDLTTLTCEGTAGVTPMKQKIPAFATPAPTTAATAMSSQVPSFMQTEEEVSEKAPERDESPTAQEEEEQKEVESNNKCDTHTSCPQHMTCCFIARTQQWGCCPLPEAVCCDDGEHCCPAHYKCDESETSCIKGELVIPWYTKLAATATTSSAEDDSGSVQCDALNQCPEHTTCCQLQTGECGCCPLQNAVCCPDKEHCCPQGYSCNIDSRTCDKLIMLQLETVPLTPVYVPEQLPQPTPVEHTDVHCDDQTSCEDGMTCCRMTATTWGCCPLPNAVCCSDMMHCCPKDYTCGEGSVCNPNTKFLWNYWHIFLSNKKRALIV